jgi:hypothetical protein
VRRALARVDEAAGLAWLERHLDDCVGPLLSEPWILDVDTTIKPLFGHQEGAEVSYNPHKPGRPSHVYHTYMIGELRLALAVEVQPGRQHHSSHAAPGFVGAARTPRPRALAGAAARRPPRVTGRGSELGTRTRGLGERSPPEPRRAGGACPTCSSCAPRAEPAPGLDPGVRRLLARAMAEGGWEAAGQGFAGKAAVLGFQTGRGAIHGNPRMRLSGWSRGRRVVLLRRRLARELAIHEREDGQLRLSFLDVTPQGERQIYEVAVLVTSLEVERDRADCEDACDELKNHWGWGGFTTQDLKPRLKQGYRPAAA